MLRPWSSMSCACTIPEGDYADSYLEMCCVRVVLPANPHPCTHAATRRLLFELSEVDLTCALEVKDELALKARIAALSDATVRALLLQAALLHPQTATRVLAAAPTPAANQPDTPPTPPERASQARDSFDALRLSRDSGRRTAQLNISGHVLDSDYFSAKARDVVAITNPPRRRDALASLCREINVMIDLGHGLFALRAIVAVLHVVTNRAGMDGSLLL